MKKLICMVLMLSSSISFAEKVNEEIIVQAKKPGEPRVKDDCSALIGEYLRCEVLDPDFEEGKSTFVVTKNSTNFSVYIPQRGNQSLNYSLNQRQFYDSANKRVFQKNLKNGSYTQTISYCENKELVLSNSRVRISSRDILRSEQVERIGSSDFYIIDSEEQEIYLSMGDDGKLGVTNEFGSKKFSCSRD